MTESSKLIQYDDGYLNKTPIFQFVLLSCLFALWGAAASELHPKSWTEKTTFGGAIFL